MVLPIKKRRFLPRRRSGGSSARPGVTPEQQRRLDELKAKLEANEQRREQAQQELKQKQEIEAQQQEKRKVELVASRTKQGQKILTRKQAIKEPIRDPIVGGLRRPDELPGFKFKTSGGTLRGEPGPVFVDTKAKVTKADTPLQRLDQQQRDKGRIGGSLSFVSNEAVNLFINKGFKEDKKPTEGQIKALRFGAEVLPYLTPAGGPLLVLSGAEKERLAKTPTERGLAQLQIGLGAVSTTLKLKQLRTTREKTLIEQAKATTLGKRTLLKNINQDVSFTRFKTAPTKFDRLLGIKQKEFLGILDAPSVKIGTQAQTLQARGLLLSTTGPGNVQSKTFDVASRSELIGKQKALNSFISQTKIGLNGKNILLKPTIGVTRVTGKSNNLVLFKSAPLSQTTAKVSKTGKAINLKNLIFRGKVSEQGIIKVVKPGVRFTSETADFSRNVLIKKGTSAVLPSQSIVKTVAKTTTQTGQLGLAGKVTGSLNTKVSPVIRRGIGTGTKGLTSQTTKLSRITRNQVQVFPTVTRRIQQRSKQASIKKQKTALLNVQSQEPAFNTQSEQGNRQGTASRSLQRQVQQTTTKNIKKTPQRTKKIQQKFNPIFRGPRFTIKPGFTFAPPPLTGQPKLKGIPVPLKKRKKRGEEDFALSLDFTAKALNLKPIKVKASSVKERGKALGIRREIIR